MSPAHGEPAPSTPAEATRPKPAPAPSAGPWHPCAAAIPNATIKVTTTNTTNRCRNSRGLAGRRPVPVPRGAAPRCPPRGRCPGPRVPPVLGFPPDRELPPVRDRETEFGFRADSGPLRPAPVRGACARPPCARAPCEGRGVDPEC